MGYGMLCAGWILAGEVISAKGDPERVQLCHHDIFLDGRIVHHKGICRGFILGLKYNQSKSFIQARTCQ